MTAVAPLFALIGGLSSIDRFTMEKLHSRESVLEHVGMVAIIAFALATELRARGEHVDFEEILTRALCHDADEVITGDIARPTKHASARSVRMFEELSCEAIEKVGGRLTEAGWRAFGPAVQAAFRDAKGGDVEGAVVALADILAVAAKVREEVLVRGNRGMVRQAHTCLRQLRKFGTDRLRNEFFGEALSFVAVVLGDAIDVMERAVAMDSPDLHSQVEEY